MSEAQAANAHGGRQASLGELRSSPVPGETELGVPESEVAAAGDEQQAQSTRSLREQNGADECRRLILYGVFSDTHAVCLRDGEPRQKALL